jgi:hypothetical protein
VRYWRCRAPAKWLEWLLWPMVGHTIKIRRCPWEAYCTRCPWRAMVDLGPPLRYVHRLGCHAREGGPVDPECDGCRLQAAEAAGGTGP